MVYPTLADYTFSVVIEVHACMFGHLLGDSRCVLSQLHMTEISSEERRGVSVITAESGVLWCDLHDALDAREEKFGSRSNMLHGDDYGFLEHSADTTMEEFVLLLDDCSSM